MKLSGKIEDGTSSVGLFVCLSVSNITPKFMNGF